MPVRLRQDHRLLPNIVKYNELNSAAVKLDTKSSQCCEIGTPRRRRHGRRALKLLHYIIRRQYKAAEFLASCAFRVKRSENEYATRDLVQLSSNERVTSRRVPAGLASRYQMRRRR
ncbi:hypothetical protein EVAR_22734_1 [Eumeta japonica]|uniref:Uncharacterized protein n=1 Tax=Eumeta variegata TaxID=151549 RepID=A0A4C1UTP1_EUMVA|nr:hypothetical protein EVAR_22734_1 [Eumeta japonica]